MTELLSNSNTKKAISHLLFHSVMVHLQERGVKYVVGDGVETHYYFGEDNVGVTKVNHEEADTLLIYCLSISPLEDLKVMVHIIDTDVFVLLLKQQSIACLCIWIIKKVPLILQKLEINYLLLRRLLC